LDIIVTATSDTVVSVSVTVSPDGYVFCSSFNSGSLPVSPWDIMITGDRVHSTSGLATIVLTALSPGSSLDIYCSTASFSGSYMPLPDILETRHPIILPGRIQVSATLTSRFFASQNVHMIAQVTLEKVPDSSLSIQPQISLNSTSFNSRRLQSVTNETLVFPSALFYNSSLTYSQLTQPIYFSATNSNVYVLDLVIQSQSSSTFSISYPLGQVFTATASLITAPPSFVSAEFTSDGGIAQFTFSHDTNRAEFDNDEFSCEEVLTFPLASSTTCSWVDPMHLIARLNPNSELMVGSLVTLQENVITSACDTLVTDCSSLKFASGSMEMSSAVKILPVVVVSAPRTVSESSFFVLDLTSSTGSGGRAWRNVTIVVSSSTAVTTSVQQFYSQSYSAVPPTPLLPGLLVKQNYYNFFITLCNFLGNCRSTSFRLFCSPQFQPSLQIAGPSSRVVSAADRLSFEATVFYDISLFSSYASFAATYHPIYQWTVYDLTSSVLIPLQTVSLTQFLNIPSYTLPIDHILNVQCVATLNNGKSSNATVMVSVKKPSWEVLLNLGDGATVQAGKSLFVKASTSIVQGNPYPYRFEYKWECLKIAPQLSSCSASEFCGGASCSGSSVTLSAASDAVCYYLSVSLVDTLSLQTNSISLVVAVTPPSVPKLSIVPIPTSFNYLQQLQVRGVINSPVVGIATWKSSIPLSQSSYLSPSRSLVSLANADVAFNLVLASNSLRSNTRYTFTLTLTTVESNIYSTAIAILTLSPPQPGIFSTSPATGLELTQIFSFSASFWSDADLPLTYTFEYAHPGRSYISLSTKGTSNQLATVLPALQNRSSWVKCRLGVADYYNAVSQAYSSLFLLAKPRNYSELVENLQQTEDENTIVSTYPIYAPIGAFVSCDLAPNCTYLNREGCSDQENTCGPCLPQFSGLHGDDNSPCFSLPIEEGTLCQQTSECLPYLSCESGVCRSTNKTCPHDCSGRGTCSFFSISSGLMKPTCLKSDTSCQAVCVCNDQYSGDSCATPITMATSQSTLVQEIICGISFRISSYLLSTTRVQQWVTILKLLSQNPRAVSTSSAFCAINISNTLLDGYEISGVSFDMSIIHSLVDTISHYDLFLDSKTQTYEQKVEIVGAITQLMFRYCSLSSRDMLVGQYPTTDAGSYVDITRVRYSSLTNVTLPISNQYNSAVDSSLSLFTLQESGICLSSIHPSVYRDLLLSDISSPILSVLVEVSPTELNQTDQHIEFTITTSESMNYGPASNSSIMKATCTSNSPQIVHCPGLDYEFDCTNRTGTFQLRCPRLLLKPACGFIEGLDVNQRICYATSSTLATVTCRCPLNFNVTTSLASLQVVALAEYTPEGVVTLVDEGQAETILKPWQVFLTMSLVFAFCLTGVYYSNKADNEEISYEKVLDEDTNLRQILSELDTSVVDSVFPIMFTEKSFLLAYLKELKHSHRWFSLFYLYSPFFPRWHRMISLYSSFNIFMLCLCLFYGYIVPYDTLIRDQCDDQTTRDDCLSQTPTFLFREIDCEWRRDEDKCEVNHFQSQYEVPFLAAIICALMSVPLVMLVDHILYEVIPKPLGNESDHAFNKKQATQPIPPADLQGILTNFAQYRDELPYKSRREFDRLWGIDSSTPGDSIEKNEVFLRMLSSDLQTVQAATASEIAIISQLPTSTARAQRLMFLFQQDLMMGIPGEVVTRTAYQLPTHSSHVSELVRNGLWLFVALFNVLLTIYIFFFGWSKGYFLQSLWARTFLIWLLLDVIFVQSLLILWTQFLIPSVLFTEIFRTRFFMLRTFQDAQVRIKGLEVLPTDNQKFNACSFMFASHRLARLSPNTFESRLILNFRMPFPKKRSMCSLHNQDTQKNHVVMSPLYSVVYSLVAGLLFLSNSIAKIFLAALIWLLVAVIGFGLILLAHRESLYFLLVIPALFLPILLVGYFVHYLVMQPREIGIGDYREFYGLQSMNSGVNPKVLPRSSSSGVVDDQILRDLDMESGDVAITVHDNPQSIVPIQDSPKKKSTEEEIIDYMKHMVAENNVEWGDDLDGQGSSPAGKSSKLKAILMKTGMMDKLFDLSDDENDDGVSARRRGRRRAARATHMRRMRSYSEDDIEANRADQSLPSSHTAAHHTHTTTTTTTKTTTNTTNTQSESMKSRPLQRLRSLSEDDFFESPDRARQKTREEEIIDYMKHMVAENNVEWGDDLDGQGSSPAGKSSKLKAILMKTGMMDKLFDLSDDENDDGVSARRRGRRRAARATHMRRMRSYSEENLHCDPSPASPSPSPRIVKRNLSDDSDVTTSPKRSLRRLRSLSEDDLQTSLQSPVSRPDKVRREAEVVDYMRSMVEEHKVEWGELDDQKHRSGPSKTSKLIQILEKNGVMDKLFDLSDEDEDDEGARPRRRVAARFTHLNRLRSFSDSELKPPEPLRSPVIHEIESLSSGSDFDDDEVPCKSSSSTSSASHSPAEIRQPEKLIETKQSDAAPTPLPQSVVNRESMIATRKAFAMASAKNDISFRFRKAKTIQKLQERLENKKATGTGSGSEGSNLGKRPSVAEDSEVTKDLTKRLEASAARRRMSLATNEQAAKNRLEQRLQNRLQQQQKWV
jgi:hypothetical protein